MGRYHCAGGAYYPMGHDMEECPPCLRAMRDGIRQEYQANVNVDLVKRLREQDQRINQQRKELAKLNQKVSGTPSQMNSAQAFDAWCMPLDRTDRRFAAVSFRAGWVAARRAIRAADDHATGDGCPSAQRQGEAER
jgi:hypothetical protein